MIPGSPEALEAAAGEMERTAAGFTDARDLVRSASGQLSTWGGVAGRGARAALEQHAARIAPHGDAVRAVAPALRTFAQELREAQRQFDRARQLSVQGLAAVRSAGSAAAPTADAARLAGQAHVDQGTTAMTAALERVRVTDEAAAAQVRQVTGTLAAMSPATFGAPTATPALSAGPPPTPAPPPSGRVDQLLNPGGVPLPPGVPVHPATLAPVDPQASSDASGPKNGKLGELKAGAYLSKVEAAGGTTAGDARLRGKFEGNVGAEAALAGEITERGIGGKADASAGARLNAEGRVDHGMYTAYGRGEALGGAEATVAGRVGREGVDLSAGAFAGAKVKGAIGGDVGGISLGATGELSAGAGAEARFQLGKGEDGKYHFGGAAGATPLVGGKLGAEITIDPEKVEKSFHEAADAIGEFSDEVDRDVESTVGSVTRALDDTF